MEGEFEGVSPSSRPVNQVYKVQPKRRAVSPAPRAEAGVRGAVAPDKALQNTPSFLTSCKSPLVIHSQAMNGAFPRCKNQNTARGFDEHQPHQHSLEDRPLLV